MPARGDLAVDPPLAPGDVGALVRFALDVTSTLELADGRYCFDRTWASPVLRGESSRYSLMVGLGMERAHRAGYSVPRAPGEILTAVLSRPDTLTAGDRGLALMLASRLEVDGCESLLRALWADADSGVDGLDGLEGMEIAWMVLGAVAAVSAGVPGAGRVADVVVARLRERLSPTTPLARHLGGGWRARFPNFATQIYTVLALADASTVLDDDAALTEATRLADLLVELRRGDCGWPWLYDAESASVVEEYEIYSVHQDAMAPMAFFALAEASGDAGYARAGADGLGWCYGDNELGFGFYDTALNFAHRSIRRSRVSGRIELYLNTLGSRVGSRRRLDLGRGRVEINDTCRPYHLGWIAEAWAGRERHATSGM